VAIIMSSFVVFLILRMDVPAVRSKIAEWQIEKQKSDNFYAAIEATPLKQFLGKMGTLPRRALILLTFLALVAYPLQRSLIRLSSEVHIRRVILADLHKLIPLESIVREDVEIGADIVRVRAIAVLPKGVPADIDHQLEQMV